MRLLTFMVLLAITGGCRLPVEDLAAKYGPRLTPKLEAMRLGAGVFLVALAGTSAGAGDVIMAAGAESPIKVVDGAGAKAHAGKLVAVIGIARDAKISAVVVADNFVVYCLGLAKWPGAESGKTVLAHGRLEHTAEFVAERGPGGEISPGTDGPVWVLRDCRYELR